MAQADTPQSRSDVEFPVLLDAAPIYVRVSVLEKERAEAEARAGGFRSIADWARQKLFYGWKKPEDEE